MATEVYTVKEPLYGPYKLYSGEPFEAAQERRNRIGKQERTNRCGTTYNQLYRSRNEEYGITYKSSLFTLIFALARMATAYDMTAFSPFWNWTNFFSLCNSSGSLSATAPPLPPGKLRGNDSFSSLSDTETESLIMPFTFSKIGRASCRE